MSADQNKGPIYGVTLPDSLPLPGGLTQTVPRRGELQRIRVLVGDRVVGALEVALSFVAAIERSGLGVSPCRSCGEAIVCTPDGLAMCRKCVTETDTVFDDPAKAAP